MRFWRGSNSRPSACKADVITTTPQNPPGRSGGRPSRVSGGPMWGLVGSRVGLPEQFNWDLYARQCRSMNFCLLCRLVVLHIFNFTGLIFVLIIHATMTC